MALTPTNQISVNPKKEIIEKQKEFIGYTGNTISAGYFYEDYIEKLNGKEAIEIWDQMRRGDAQVKMILTAIKNPIKSATFSIPPLEDDDQSKKIADFLSYNWFKNPLVKFTDWVSEALTHLEFGFSIHEKKYAAVNTKDFGMVHVLGGLGFRKQNTIEQWEIDGKNGLKGIRQIADGDTVSQEYSGNSFDSANSSGDVFIPVEDLVIMTNEKEGDGYDGISILRSSYGAWFRKNLKLKLDGIGIEKGAIGTPIGTYPARGQGKEEKEEFIKTISNFAGHQSSYMVVPEGYTIDVVTFNYDSSKVIQSVVYEDGQIAKSILFQFLELGQNGSSGSYALGADQSDLALASIQFIGDYICAKMDEINRDLVRWNFGEKVDLPLATCTGINQKKGKELSELIKNYVEAGVIRPDDNIEANIRETHNLPKFQTTREDDEKKAQKSAAQNGSGSTKPDPIGGNKQTFSEPSGKYFRSLSEYEMPINLADIKEVFESEGEKLHRLMKTELTILNTNALRITETLLKKNKENRIKVATDFVVNAKSYEKHLTAQLGNIAGEGSRTAANDLKSKGALNLAEGESFRAMTQFLPEQVKAALILQSKEQVATQARKIENIVGFGIVNGVDGEKTDKEIIKDIEIGLDDYKNSPQVDGAARTMASININRGRNGFFFDKENIKSIQAFEYSAILDGRTTPICLSLDGQISKPGDRGLLAFRPPNHFGCRSILVPITINEKTPKSGAMKPDPDNGSFKIAGKPKPTITQINKSRNL